MSTLWRTLSPQKMCRKQRRPSLGDFRSALSRSSFFLLSFGSGFGDN